MKIKNIFFLLSLSLHAQNMEELFNAGIQAYNQGDLEKSGYYFAEVLKLDPDNPGALLNCANVYRKLNALDQSIAAYEKFLTKFPRHDDAAFGLAQAYLAKGIIDKGWQHFNMWRTRQILQKCPKSLAEVKGKKVIIRTEWGLGDVMHFIRYAQLLKNHDAYVIAELPKSLTHIIASCPFIDKIAIHGGVLPETDYEIPLLYLPTLCKTDAQNIPAPIPYLFADKQLVNYWSKQISKNSFNIGICWDIGHHDTNLITWQRTAPLSYWLPVAKIPGIKLYSVQKDHSDLDMINNINLHIFDSLDTKHGGFMDTAAIMINLDLVITVDTSVAHLAGALGVPVWTLLPYSPDYRWTLKGNTTPWYPTMRLFRQPKSGYWESVIDEIAQAVKEIVG